MRIKICGITNFEDADVAVKHGADAIGFIFYTGSKRNVLPAIAKAIIEKLPAFITKVGVFVNEGVEKVNSVSAELGLNFVQLHGDESVEYISEIKTPVIKAFRINDNFNFTSLSEYKNCHLLLDSFDTTEYGGTGKKFKWDIIPNEIRNRVILAGGIQAGDVEFIYNKLKPQAIDVSSSIEKEPGIKDHTKLKELLNTLNKFRYLNEQE